MEQIGCLLVFIGTSLTAGFGVEPQEAFPALIRQRMEKRHTQCEVNTLAWGGASALTVSDRLERLHLKKGATVVFVELGANDGLHFVSPALIGMSIGRIIDQIRDKWPSASIVVLGVSSDSLGVDGYREDFRRMFRSVAADRNVLLVPNILEDVAGDPGMNLYDGLHPNVEGHRRISENVLEYLQPILERFD